MNSNLNKFLLFVVFFIGFFLENAQSEFLCSAEVRYQWKKESSNGVTAEPPTKSKDKDAAGTEQKDPNVRDTFYRRLEAKGETEDQAKTLLNNTILDARSKADAVCKDLHENQSKCLSNKFTQSASVFGSITFSQRKELEKKIVQDCEVAAGACLGSAMTEPVCKEIVVAKPAEEAAAPAAKGKEAKKK